MVKKRKIKTFKKTPIETVRIDAYSHKGKTRKNNPPVGLVTPETDANESRKTYQYDPHIDPSLQWSGKAEHTSFEIDTVSLHVHERIDPYSIISHLKSDKMMSVQTSLFESPMQRLSNKEVIEFYKHDQNWANRLIAGDSLLVMNSLLEKEGMSGKVQMVYFDPPYGIKYGSNFQPFINKRDVKDGKDDDLNQEPEMIKAFRDTWELGIHSYLTYIRDRLLLARDLLADSGSIFIQIGDENLHLIRNILDEVFGKDNFFSLISFKKTLPLGSSGLAGICDYILWYAKDKQNIKFRNLYIEKPIGQGSGYTWIEEKNGNRRKMTKEEKENPTLIPEDVKVFFTSALASSGYTETCMYDFEFQGKRYKCGKKSWRTTKEGMQALIRENRIIAPGDLPCYIQYHKDFPFQPLHNMWNDTHGASDLVYVVQTSNKVIQRCLLMATDPGDLVLDITCGSGATAFVSEQFGRRWITCDTSRVAIALAKQRLMTATYSFYELSVPDEGVSSGFKYRTAPHITLGSIANNEPPAIEMLYDQPLIDKDKIRVSGLFTVEAVPAPTVKSLEEKEKQEAKEVDTSITRTGATLKYNEWKDELLKTGIRAKNNQRVEFTRVETLAGTKYLHAEAETKEAKPQRVVISFGHEHSPLEQRQVALALEEANLIVPKPKMVVFVAFQFDPEAAKDIDEINFPGVQVQKVQMNTDLLTKDLKKKQSSSDSFFFIGSPDAIVHKKKEQYTVEVNGFDYYDVKTGQVVSGDNTKIAMWLLDTDYDGRSLLPTQVFFPMGGSDGGWDKLSKNLKALLDEDKIEAFHGAESLPFNKGQYGRAAIKIIDDRGIESLKILDLE